MTKTLSDGIELDQAKVAAESERDIDAAETAFYASVGSSFDEAVRQTQAAAADLNNSLVIPLKEGYASNGDTPTKLFLDKINREINSYNSKVFSALTRFRSAFGIQNFNDRYGARYNQLLIKNYVNPTGRDIVLEMRSQTPVFRFSGQLHGIYSRTLSDGLNVSAESTATIVAIAVGAIAASPLVIVGLVLDATKDIPLVRDTIANIIRTILEAYQALWYALWPGVKQRMDAVRSRAETLDRYATNAMTAFTQLSDAMQSLMTNITDYAPIYQKQIQDMISPPAAEPAYVPQDAAPNKKRAGKSILYQAAGERFVPYSIKESPTIIKTASGVGIKYERQFSGFLPLHYRNN